MRKYIDPLFSLLGYQLVKKSYAPELWDMSQEQDKDFNAIYDKASPYTMTSKERMYALYQAVCYVQRNNIAGDIVECGVWRGGSSLLSALTLIHLNDFTRSLYLYDTFAGMPEPTAKDTDYAGKSAKQGLKDLGLSTFGEMCHASLEDVQHNLATSGYPNDKITYVKGKVEETIPKTLPKSISILRLDTDWYESTYHELTHLFPLLSPHGVVIIDDYGHWRGARDATDQYISENKIRILLNRIDDTGRIAIKV